MITTTITKRGRKQRAYQASWGEMVPGLWRLPDGRWMIHSTGQRFSEPDERRAIARFCSMVSSTTPVTKVEVKVRDIFPTAPDRLDQIDDKLHDKLVELSDCLQDDTAEADSLAELPLRMNIPDEVLWPWLRKMLLDQPEWIAKKTGIPALANLRNWDAPQNPLKLDALGRLYQEHADVAAGTRRHVLRAWADFMDRVGVQTLPEVTTEKLTAYRTEVRCKYAPETVANTFTRVKMVLKFAMSEGRDETQITAALNRMSVCKPPKRRKRYDPTPIDKAVYHKLLGKADDLGRAALLLSLNAALYVSECLAVDWDEIDLDAGTYLTSRNKTGVIRCATLWDETVEALKRLPRTPGAVFKSMRGDRYHENSYRKVFAQLRKDAGVSSSVEFNQIRDGAYTACVVTGVPLHLCQILAGHRAAGQIDNYVARNPEVAKPACDAVHKKYFE